MSKLEKGNWPPYNVKAITNNINLVFKSCDITKLDNIAYTFIVDQMSFIAHYDLYGFRDFYKDLRLFAHKLQASEYSTDINYTLHKANRQKTDSDFSKWYGSLYNESIAETIYNIIDLAREHEPVIKKWFDKKQKDNELAKAKLLAKKYGYELKKTDEKVN